ncbi:MAG TPA: DUF998 domain-containing protein [Candidatus Limnocylindrales bacterium]
MRKLLWCGVIAGPLFTIVLLIQGAARPDYDPLRHPGSSLAIGPGGWVQSANFIVAGLLTLAFSLSMGTRRAWLVAVWALGLIGAGIFVSDPVNGYPPGTPLTPATLTAAGRGHDAVSLAGFLALLLAFFAFARGRGRAWAVYSVVSAVVYLGALVLSSIGWAQVEPWVDLAGLLQRVAVVTGWAWLTALAYYAIRHSG